MRQKRSDRICETCGKNFLVHPCRVRRGGGRFCSVACTIRRTRKKSISRTCETCGKQFLVYPCHLRGGKGGRFCSVACRPAPRRGRTMLGRVCQECGKAFQIRKGNGGPGKYCSISCAAIARGRKRRGPNHPFWKGGISERPFAIRKFIRDIIIERGRCERCGDTVCLHGHHKKSYKDFPALRYNLKNIEVLCVNCHAKEHPDLRNFILSNEKELRL
jgi:5-methylcytosine-specific restriction endonuclease McrA